MSTSPRRLSKIAIAPIVAGALALGAGAQGGAAQARSSHSPHAHAAHRDAHRGHASRRVRSRRARALLRMTGLGNEQAQMFANPLWRQLHTRIVRYVVPYDAVAHSWSLDNAIRFIAAAEAAHQKVLVAFYHSEYTPTRLPSVRAYQRDVRRFIELFPHVSEYESWDESNRGNVPHLFSSPSATAAARYYRALKRVCHRCTVVGLDVLDAYDINATLRYIWQFKREIHRLRTIMPRVWGLHNYSDVNRMQSWRTRDLVRALGGRVWLTETGGIVKFGGAFPNRRGSGLRRAAKVLRYTFGIAHLYAKIKRLYIYDWNGGTAATRFDAGLTNAHERPRAGYIVVCKHLHARRCHVHVARN